VCQEIEISVSPAGILKVFPTDCSDGGATCRTLSAPFAALGRTLADVDLGTSHVVAVKLEVKDLDALEKVAESIGMQLVRGQTTWKWYGKWVDDYSADDAAYKNGIAVADYGKCEHALVIPGKPDAYEVGVIALPGGGFTLGWDFYGGGNGLMAKIGAGGQKLLQGYGLEVVKKTAIKQGHFVLGEVPMEDGSIRLRVRVPQQNTFKLG
jgi:hypothetical protein